MTTFEPPVGFLHHISPSMTAQDALTLLEEIEAQSLVADIDLERAREELRSGLPPSDVLRELAKHALH